jgi:hypothetical protein
MDSSLLDSRVCYPADWSITGAGLSPARKAAVLGCTVVPIEAAAFRYLDDRALLAALDRARLRAVHGEGLMTTPAMVDEPGIDQVALRGAWQCWRDECEGSLSDLAPDEPGRQLYEQVRDGAVRRVFGPSIEQYAADVAEVIRDGLEHGLVRRAFGFDQIRLVLHRRELPDG